jgi:hypothetical protein
MTKWFLDTEFNEDGRTIDLISIALVNEVGGEKEWVSRDFDEYSCNDFVKANVLPQLPPRSERVPRWQIAAELRALVLVGDDKPEFWAYFADYDWVALCQLYGPMVDLPKGFPYWCRDLKQLMDDRGIKKEQLPKQNGAEHSALNDARWVRDAYIWIQNTPRQDAARDRFPNA